MNKLLDHFNYLQVDIEKRFLKDAVKSHMIKSGHELIINEFVDAKFDKRPCYTPDAFITAVIDDPLWYHKKGLMQTASGYGRKLVTTKKVKCADGKTRRVFCHCFSNSGVLYIVIGGQDFIVKDYLL